MHAYFIDDWTGEARHRRAMDSLDLQLTQAGLSGRRIRLSRLHDLDASLQECRQSGVRDFVAVGDDGTFSRLLNGLLKNPAQGLVLSTLPVGEKLSVAAGLGHADLGRAVLALAEHRTRIFDVGKLNDRHCFITAAIFPERSSLKFLSYTISSLRPNHQISICNTNLYNYRDARHSRAFNPSDGTFEAVIAYQPNGSWWANFFPRKKSPSTYVVESFFPHQSLIVLHKEKTITIQADTEKQLSTPVEVAVVSRGIEVVVGANYK